MFINHFTNEMQGVLRSDPVLECPFKILFLIKIIF